MKEVPPKPTYRCVKTSLKSVAKNNLVIDKLTDAVLCKAPSTGKPPSAETQIIKDTLKNFYEQHYKAYVSEELSCRQHMSTMLDYLSTGVITMCENNIKHSYVEYVERYVNVSWRKKKLVAIIRKSGRNTRSRQDALCCALACLGSRTTCSEAETLSGLSTLPHNHDFLH